MNGKPTATTVFHTNVYILLAIKNEIVIGVYIVQNTIIKKIPRLLEQSRDKRVWYNAINQIILYHIHAYFAILEDLTKTIRTKRLNGTRKYFLIMPKKIILPL